MTKAGTGYVAAHYAAELARTDRSFPMSPTRAFAEKNPEAIVKDFRAAIDEAAEIVNNDREKASVSIANFTKQPIEIVRLNRPNLAAPDLKAEQFGLVARRDEAAGPVADRDRRLETRAAMILDLSAAPIERPRRDTLSERVAALVEADIVSGALAPGSRLAIADLAAHYGIGATPVREACRG